jgi:hypothetical protein
MKAIKKRPKKETGWQHSIPSIIALSSHARANVTLKREPNDVFLTSQKVIPPGYSSFGKEWKGRKHMLSLWLKG